ncbi:MAG: DNA translocase FtsK [Gammaproteobacteria bacterium]|nr:DNA translocase FtsK [Gammaproteobacteria bacterium]
METYKPIQSSPAIQSFNSFEMNGMKEGVFCDPQALSRLHEVFLIATMLVSILTLVSLFKWQPSSQHGWAFFLDLIFGKMRYLVPAFFMYAGSCFYIHWHKPFQGSHTLILKLIGSCLFFLSLEMIGQGGELGAALSNSIFGDGSLESIVVIASIFLVGLFLMTRLSFYEITIFAYCAGKEFFFRKMDQRDYRVAQASYQKEQEITRREPVIISYDSPRSEMVISDSQTKRLIDCLGHFGIHATPVGKEVGPVITRFEIELLPGVKSATLCNHYKDIARSLRVANVRVLEVIPGKSCVGIEVPNENREVFGFEELRFKLDECVNETLPLLLGKTVNGFIKILDLKSHILIAGATESGKTSLLQSMLMSLTSYVSSDGLKLILIDPKCLSFKQWKNIPHLLMPIITDNNDAMDALTWCVNEMERRYDLMAKESNPKFPSIVVFIDEFGNLMMTHKNEIESAVGKLAQKSRQCGIHLVLSTQRSTADVVTGNIKTNMTTRIALSVPDKRDSRNILDENGAYTLYLMIIVRMHIFIIYGQFIFSQLRYPSLLFPGMN